MSLSRFHQPNAPQLLLFQQCYLAHLFSLNRLIHLNMHYPCKWLACIFRKLIDSFSWCTFKPIMLVSCPLGYCFIDHSSTYRPSNAKYFASLCLFFLLSIRLLSHKKRMQPDYVREKVSHDTRRSSNTIRSNQSATPGITEQLKANFFLFSSFPSSHVWIESMKKHSMSPWRVIYHRKKMYCCGRLVSLLIHLTFSSSWLLLVSLLNFHIFIRRNFRY